MGRAARIIGRLMTTWLGSTQPIPAQVENRDGWVMLPPEPLVFVACPDLWPEHTAAHAEDD